MQADRELEDEFFDAQDQVPYFAFDFPPEEWDYIHKDPRRFAECTMTVDDDPKEWKGVAVKLKGSAGSFRGPDDKPGLSVSMNKYKPAERWHGFLKWHLNNGAQDGSFLNEQLSCEVARMAGVPASRCAHAMVRWQKRDLGLFVFKEAFDRDFLSKFFRNPDGDLYDGGFVAEIHPDMEKDQGDRERRDNVKELIAACQESDQKKRWERMEKILDVNEYISFTAIENITCHWDGYNYNRNNYRLYFDADTGKACFFIHGTDQTWGDANFAINRDSGSLVGQAVLSNPEWKQMYMERVEEIYKTVLKPIDWGARVTEIGAKTKTAIAKRNPGLANDFGNHINEARDRVVNRIAAIGKQLDAIPKPLRFDKDGIVQVSGDNWQQQGSGANFDTPVVDGKNTYHITANGESTGSWRKSMNLPAGKYKLLARVRTAGVAATQSSSGEGAGVRISGGNRTGQNGLSGDTDWRELSFQFDASGDVTFVAELRGSKGEAWFDKESFRVQKIPQ